MKLSRVQKKAELMAEAQVLIEELLDWDERTKQPNLTQIEDEVLALRQRMGQRMAEVMIEGQEALYQALASGRLAAAGLDVWYNYPQGEAERSHTLPSAYPFHTLDNVVLSPHCGGGFGSPYTERQRMAHLARLFNALHRGQPAPNRVDLALGC